MSESTIEVRCGCLILRTADGRIPLKQLGAMTKKSSHGSVLDTNAARMAEAAMVVGQPADLERLRDELAPAARLRVARRHPNLSREAQEWLATGDQGRSSLAILHAATGARPPGFDPGDGIAQPHDPADLRRCRLLLEAVPEAQRGLQALEAASPEWRALTDAWHSLCDTMDAEMPDWRQGEGSAGATYDAMRSLLDASPSRRL